MANLMGITNPAPAYDSTANNKAAYEVQKPSETKIQNIVDPSRVVRADSKAEQKNANDMHSAALKYSSNLQTFLEQLTRAPDLGAELARAISLMQSSVSTPGLEEGIAKEMAEFLQHMKMNPEEFKQHFMSQVRTQNRFSGPLFSLLRNVYNSTANDTVKDAILNFLKRFSDYSSTEHIKTSISQNLNIMSQYMPSGWHDKLFDMLAKLQSGFAGATRGENIATLQNDIIPFLANYIERTNDMGMARTYLSMLMLNIARYENGSEDALLQSFRQMSGFNAQLTELNALDNANLMKLFNNTNYISAVREDKFAEMFSNMAQKALSGAFGSEMREIFSEIVRAMLLNESVYMPLLHNIIPLDYNGKLMYSEMWVDPDAKGNSNNSRNYNKNDDRIQFLFKLDIQSLGYMEMVIAAKKGSVDLDIFGPQALVDNAELISEDISTILSDYDLNGQNVKVGAQTTPLAITQVFPDLFDGRSNVNVKI